MKLHVKSGDAVIVIAGEDKGKQGKVQKAFPATGKVVVEGVNIVKVHKKPRGQGMPGGIFDKEAAIDASNVMLVCPNCKKPARVGHKVVEVNGKKTKQRVCKECGQAFEN